MNVHVTLDTLVTVKSVKMSTNVLPTHVTLTDYAPILLDLTAAHVMRVTPAMDSHAKTSTNVKPMFVVTIPLVPISQVASHALALMASMVMLWKVVLTSANVATSTSTSVI
jgi:hypothetical protein